MLNYRKKILLALIEIFGNDLPATDFQKLLFLFTDRQTEKCFSFVPYKYGCFSFQAMADKNSLIRDCYLKDNTNWSLKTKSTNYIFDLKETDRKILNYIKMQYGGSKSKDLIIHIYINYPYYAINSEIAEKYLSRKELQNIKKFVPTQYKTELFTIGYEGTNLENYLNKLIKNNIKVLCDIRKNPISRKYGFSKKTLKNACEGLNIKYIHFPELGIVSEKRQYLKSQADYNKLFDEYEHTIIPKQKYAIEQIFELLQKEHRIALTCFEASHKQCHRSRVAKAISCLPKWDYSINHI